MHLRGRLGCAPVILIERNALVASRPHREGRCNRGHVGRRSATPARSFSASTRSQAFPKGSPLRLVRRSSCPLGSLRRRPEAQLTEGDGARGDRGGGGV